MARMTPKRKIIGKTKILHLKILFMVIPSLLLLAVLLMKKPIRLNLFRGTQGIPDSDSLISFSITSLILSSLSN
jgi:hypothetical protein